MHLAVSNIAWTNEEEPAIADLLNKLGVRYVELAPTKKWDDLTSVGADEADAYREFWNSHGINIVACQSLLFSRPDLKIFESAANRQMTRDYLEQCIGTVKALGAEVMVFGSPKNRQRGSMPDAQAMELALAFFNQLGTAAKVQQSVVCIEPNAAQYGCDFITNAREGIDFVKAVGNPGLRLHLDTGCMTLAGDNIVTSIAAAASLLRHFHITSPLLGPVEAHTVVRHDEAAATLRDIGYKGFVSIEMIQGESGTNLERVERAVLFAQQTYHS